MKRLLFVLFWILLTIPSFAFVYEYEGQTLIYNIISSSDGTTCVEVDSNCNITGILTIPDIVEYRGVTYSVTKIGRAAFYACSGLTSVEIPNSVTEIGDIAFCGCSSLTSVEIPNSVTVIGWSAFSYCSILTSVEIPNSVTEIGKAAFYDCRGLTSVEIPNSVTEIGRSAFYGCRSLTSVEIPNSVTKIEDRVFCTCISLTSVEIPNSVTGIGDEAFSGCRSLTSVEIPNSVTGIGDLAFSGCSSLTLIECNAITPPLADITTFDEDTYSKALLIVPEEATGAYKNHYVWRRFVISSPIPVESIELDPAVKECVKDEIFRITAIIYPENATNKRLEWTSSDKNTATVDNEGYVTVLKSGNCEITAKATDGSGVEASCIISVITNVDEIAAEEESEIMVFNLSGIMVLKTEDTDELNNLEDGVYIIRQGDKTRKIIGR